LFLIAATKKSSKATSEESVLTKFKLFQLLSKAVLVTFKSSTDISFNLIASSALFNGTFPKKVTTIVPISLRKVTKRF